MSRQLYPPIDLIRIGLFGEEPPLAEVPAAPLGADDESSPEMPAFLTDLVHRRVKSQAAFPPEAPAAGQIRRLARIPASGGPGRALGRSCGVLLGANQGSQCWSGWIVAQEADYASEQDLVLQEEDAPLDPEAAMVQAWNPVRIRLNGDEAILGKLTPHRLAAVISLEEGSGARGRFVAPRPGRIGVWSLADGSSVVTGTPLGDSTDPRREYRRLYGNLSEEIQAAAVYQPPGLKPSVRPNLPEWLRQVFVRPAWTFGAMALLLAQGIWIALSPLLPPEETTVYRSTLQKHRDDACAPRLRIIFKADAPYAEVVVLLRRMEATLADGPSETGEIWITLPSDRKDEETTDTLKRSSLVESADVMPGAKESCKL